MNTCFRLCPFVLAMILAGTGGCTPSEERSGFAGLGAESGEGGVSEGKFLQPGPRERISLPEDLGPHPRHRIEWWYLTANLTTASGKPLGLQWTQFRQALKPRPPEQEPPAPSQWPLEVVWMAHGAISFEGEHRFREKLARGGIGHAGAQADPFRVWLDDWELVPSEGSGRWQLKVEAEDWSYDLTLTPRREPVRHGQNGFSAKSASGEGSMYFSYVDLAIAGTVELGGESHAVEGTGWFDREWSSQFLKSEQKGWDWMALHLESGDKLMVFQLRENDSSFRAGTWVSEGARGVALAGDDVQLKATGMRETEEGEVPVEWRVRVPSRNVDLLVRAAPGQFWNRGVFPYWESPVEVSGSHQGRGYLELTGYGRRRK